VNNYELKIRPFGPHAVLLEWPNEVNEGILEDILRFIGILKSKVDVSSWEIVPAYNSLTLISRNKTMAFETVKADLLAWYKDESTHQQSTRFLWRLPVCYDVDFGIDLLEVADTLALDVPQLIEMHTAYKYTVYGIGFLPGFMYLGGLPKELEVARRKTPRLKVAKGSVGIAAKQTGIYPQESPGGWNIIGNCSVPMFNVNSKDPCFVNVGDQVQFFAIERAEHELHQIEAEVGIYKIEKIPIHAKSS